MKKPIKYLLLTLSVSLLSACGGGGGSSSGSSSPQNNNDEPLAAYSSNSTVELADRTITTQAGFDGDILAVVPDGSTEINFELANGIASMNIDNVEKIQTTSYDCEDGTNAKITFSQEFATGIERIEATANNQEISCSTTYPIGAFPSTITSPASIDELLQGYDVEDGGTEISSDCPQNPSDELVAAFGTPNPTTCEVALFTDITVTDDTNTSHIVSSEQISVPK